MIIVTGGAGFIGSNIVKVLNEMGHDDIVVVDDLTDGRKFKNLVECDIADYVDYESFLPMFMDGLFDGVNVVFHEGACSTTTEWDGRYLMDNNYEYSKTLLHACLEQKIKFIYASSAATYGAGETFIEERQYEAPLNVYGYSKFLFDEYVRSILPEAKSQIVGCRYFNVYGPREFHKGGQASVAFHLNNQLKENGVIKLFEGSDGYDAGEQVRDFIYVRDVVKINLWFYKHSKASGIFNIGTGQARSFNDLAKAVITWHGKGKLEYIPFPEQLKGCYQSYTQADLTNLRKAGCDIEFTSLEDGVKAYLDWLNR